MKITKEKRKHTHIWRRLCKRITCSIANRCKKNVGCAICAVKLQEDVDRVNKEYYAKNKEAKIKALEAMVNSPEFKQCTKSWYKVEEHLQVFGHLPFKNCCKNL